MTVLDIIGIHEDDIEHVLDNIINLFDELNLSYKYTSKIEKILESSKFKSGTGENIQKQIIDKMIKATVKIIKTNTKPFEFEIKEYQNGRDSDIYINNEDKLIIKTISKLQNNKNAFKIAQYLKNNGIYPEDIANAMTWNKEDIEALTILAKDNAPIVLYSSSDDFDSFMDISETCASLKDSDFRYLKPAYKKGFLFPSGTYMVPRILDMEIEERKQKQKE